MQVQLGILLLKFLTTQVLQTNSFKQFMQGCSH